MMPESRFEESAANLRSKEIERQRRTVRWRPSRVEDVLRICAADHQTTPWELANGPSTKRNVAARAQAMQILRRMGFSLPEIGRYMGGKHHTTVLYHTRNVKPDTRDLTGVCDEWI